jgi:predicted DNA-binding protein with PD1-like motif
MNVMCSDKATQVVAIGLQPGDMLLESVRKAAEERHIVNGAVISGVGTLKTCRMHYVQDTEFPPTDRFFTLEKPLELLSVSGLIADGEPHLHIVVSRGEDEVYAGHLEDNSEVLYLAEVAILVFNDIQMARHVDELRGIKLLGPKE